MARSYKLSWSPELNTFVLPGDNIETLPAMLERLARQFLET
jgi:hypothetical protein